MCVDLGARVCVRDYLCVCVCVLVRVDPSASVSALMCTCACMFVCVMKAASNPINTKHDSIYAKTVVTVYKRM